jgi:hypothetical protein
MSWVNLKKAGVRILSILILFLTFGLYSIPGTEAQVKNETHTTVSQSETSDNDLLNDLKDKARADYRTNIKGHEGSAHGGKLNG